MLQLFDMYSFCRVLGLVLQLFETLCDFCEIVCESFCEFVCKLFCCERLLQKLFGCCLMLGMFGKLVTWFVV